MQTKCDRCEKSVRDVGRLTKIRWNGFNQKLCRECKRKVKLGLH
jgi:hypothetical protein